MKSQLNLLPESVQRADRLRTRLHRWSVIVMSVLLIAAGSGLWSYRSLRRVSISAEAVRTKAEPFRQTTAEIGRLQGRLANLHKRNSLAAGLDARRPSLQLLGVVSRSARASGGVMFVETLRLSEVAHHPPDEPRSKNRRLGRRGPARAKKEPVMVPELTIVGSARDDLTVTQFLLALKQSGMFDAVTLQSTIDGELEPTGRGTKSETGDAEKLRHFQIICSYGLPPRVATTGQTTR